MSQFNALQKRLDHGDVIILDGAIGTQLQEMGLPIYQIAWAATALHTHPSTVQLMHESYVKAGADVITTNTYASARHNLEPIGLGELTGELNRRAVLLAREARDKAAGGRPVLIAGSISNRLPNASSMRAHRLGPKAPRTSSGKDTVDITAA